MPSLPSFPAELAITIADGSVWLGIGLAILFGGFCLAVGISVSRAVGLLRMDAPAGETLGVGLASGLVVLAASWAAIWSGGRSSFTPVAVGFLIAVALALSGRTRVQRPRSITAAASEVEPRVDGDSESNPSRRRAFTLTAVGSAVFIVVLALMYGSTLAPSPRDGVQPVEFTDEAFYSILGRDLAATGTETNLSPSGFLRDELPGLPSQTWYHWGEVWLASAVITIFGAAPLAARHLVVLPVVMLAAAALTGTLVRRFARTNSRPAYVFGVLACLFLAPIPFIASNYFSASNVGLIFGVTTYGLSAVAVLLALYGIAILNARSATWGLAIFAGSAAAFILPAHIGIALLAGAVVATIWAFRIVQASRGRRSTVVPLLWRRAIISAVVALGATLVWAVLTGHTQGNDGGGTLPVPPFNPTWRGHIAVTIVGGGLFFAIAINWYLVRTSASLEADLYLGAIAVMVAGAILWGARIADFTAFHLFFGAVAVLATPVAAIATRTLWQRFRTTNHRTVALGLVALCAFQLEFGAVNAVFRMQAFGPLDYRSTPVSLLDAIRRLPADAKLAYGCRQFEEIGFATPRLLSIDAHTGHRIIPICFAAGGLGAMVGGQSSDREPNPFFASAPQRGLYPSATASPSPAEVVVFLKAHAIGYLYVDAVHPNTLVPDAVLVASDGDFKLVRVP